MDMDVKRNYDDINTLFLLQNSLYTEKLLAMRTANERSFVSFQKDEFSVDTSTINCRESKTILLLLLLSTSSLALNSESVVQMFKMEAF
jgi:hypothetical protein